MASKVTERLAPLHARYVLGEEATSAWLASRLRIRDERGDITSNMVGAALMAGVAIAVIAFLRSRLETRAQTVPLE